MTDTNPSLREPISAATAIAYTAFGVALYAHAATPETVVMAFVLFFLGAGTFAMHASKTVEGHKLDLAGMNAAFAALATFAAGGSWPLMVIAATAGFIVFEYVLDVPNRHIMGIFMWITMVGAYATGHLLLLGLGILSMGIAFLFWLHKRDWSHGLIWHTGTAFGYYLLALANGA